MSFWCWNLLRPLTNGCNDERIVSDSPSRHNTQDVKDLGRTPSGLNCLILFCRHLSFPSPVDLYFSLGNLSACLCKLGTVFWDVTPCSQVDIYRRFGIWVSRRVARKMIIHVHGKGMVTSIHLQDYMVSYQLFEIKLNKNDAISLRGLFYLLEMPVWFIVTGPMQCIVNLTGSPETSVDFYRITQPARSCSPFHCCENHKSNRNINQWKGHSRSLDNAFNGATLLCNIINNFL
jgi:hypothetical protein